MTKRKPLNRGNQNDTNRTHRRPAKGGEKPSGGHRDTNKTQGDSRRGDSRKSQGNSNKNPDWLYGAHAVHAALQNSKRTIHRLLATRKAAEALPQSGRNHQIELKTGDEIADLLPQGAVHQGLALHVAPLPELDLIDVFENAAPKAPLLILDQVSDPHNVGAILRSASAFGAAAVIVQDRHAPQITGVMAKSASGAVEVTPIIRVTNLSRALEEIADAGYFRVGLAGESEAVLGKTQLGEKVALILGAEGPGMRRLTREKCDVLVKLPTQEPISSLNVSNAAAVALFAIQSQS